MRENESRRCDGALSQTLLYSRPPSLSPATPCTHRCCTRRSRANSKSGSLAAAICAKVGGGGGGGRAERERERARKIKRKRKQKERRRCGTFEVRVGSLSGNFDVSPSQSCLVPPSPPPLFPLPPSPSFQPCFLCSTILCTACVLILFLN